MSVEIVRRYIRKNVRKIVRRLSEDISEEMSEIYQIRISEDISMEIFIEMANILSEKNNRNYGRKNIRKYICQTY